MMEEESRTYQCPACTGPLRYDGATGRLVCDYCGSSFEPKDLEQEPREAEDFPPTVDDTVENPWTTEEADALQQYHCPACGALLACDETTAATSCPYCGNPLVLEGKLKGGLRPELILPFRLDKEQAKAALRQHYKKKALLPRAFQEENHLEELKGVYVPFWLYDCRLWGRANYQAQRLHSWREGDYRVTETQHYLIRREGTMEFSSVPVDGSRKMPDTLMDAIEPFDYSGLRPFSSSYLPGFFAEVYDVDREEAAQRMEQRVQKSLQRELRRSVIGYEAVVPSLQQQRLLNQRAHYALLPVWLLSTRWRGQNYLFAMNGQTGRLIGDLPCDWRRYWAYFAGCTGLFGALILALWQLL